MESSTEKLILTSVRLPESLKSRLLHLIADGKVKSIQAAILESLEDFIESKEKEGL